MTQSPKLYFPNLNGLRFIAAFLVIIHHLEQLLSIFGLKNYWDNPVIGAIGGLGVELFFVLSGFLISYLLFVEHKSTSNISIKDFYIRRVLRIWPLYYFIGLLAFFILPHFKLFEVPGLSEQLTSNFGFSLLLYVFFLPNLLLGSFDIVVPYASQAWSVGVEEQFYLVWPLIIKFFKNKLLALLAVIVTYFLIQKIGFRFLFHFFPSNNFINILFSFWSSFHIQCMAIGGVFAWIYFNNHKSIQFLSNLFFYLFVLVTTILFMLFSVHLPYFNREIYALLFGVIILNLSMKKEKGLFLENPILNFLGKIS